MPKPLFFLLFAFSLCFAEPAKKTETIYDTVIVNKTVIDTITIHKFNPDSLTVALLQNSETFYSNKFNMLLGAVALLFAGFGLFNWKSNNKLEKDFSNIQKRILGLEQNTKEQIESQKEKSDVMARLISKRYFDLALAELKKDDFYEYFSNMYLFCVCIMGIKLNAYDLDNLYIAYKEFEKKYNNEVISGIEPILCKFIEYLLKLIKHCEDTNQSDCFEDIKSIYNKLCAKFPYDKIKIRLNKELDLCRYKPEKIKEVLDLFERYTDKWPPQ